MGNTTTDCHSIVADGGQLCIKFEEERSVIEPLIAFRQAINKITSGTKIKDEISDNPLSEADKATFWAAIKHCPTELFASTESITIYSELLQSQLANPAGWGHYPVLDSLSFTMVADAKELKRLNKYINSSKCGRIFAIRDTVRRNNYKPEEQIKNFYQYNVCLTLRNSKASIYLSYGLKSSEIRSNQRPVRISLNPSRFTKKQLKKVFREIRNSGVFNDYKKTIEDANVTRLDLALDLIGIPTPLVILSKTGVENYNFYPKIQIDDNDLFVQTVRAGRVISSNTILYSKMHKILNRKQKHLALIVDTFMSPVDVCRFERSLKPQASGNEMKLFELVGAAYMLAQTKIYSPLILKQFSSHVRQKILRKGYMPWANEPREAVLSAHKEALRRYEVFINHSWFKAQQERMLRNVLQCIILDS